MQVWMLWHGGNGNYAPPEIPRDVEHFDSLRAAKDAFWRRSDFDPYYPCVTDDVPDAGGPSAWIFFYDPTDESNGPGDPYPDRIIEFGPRGGVRVSYA